MSKIAIKGATTGTGTFTIESPATNTDRTLTLPDEAGTVLTSASTFTSLNIQGTLSDDTQTNPETLLTIGASYNSTGANGGAGAGARIELQVPDDETNPTTGAAIGSIKTSADDSDSSSGLAFYTSNNDTTLDEAMRIDSSGNVGIGDSTPTAATGTARFLKIGDSSTSNCGLILEDETNEWELQCNDSLTVFVNDTYKASFNTGTGLLIGTSNNSPAESSTETGIRLGYSGRSQFSAVSNSIVIFNRTSDDGTLIDFRQNGTSEGSISVSGSTVSYNGGHLARWSRLADDSKDTSIVKGTVMTNLDAMVEWSHEAVDEVLDEDGNIVTEAKEAYTEDNEQLNKMAVSSVEGDPNVAGVFVNWDEDDDDFNDMNVAMTGDMVIRIASGTTVARGDLLMSAGDGTAKPQGDDIVRSKTIAKVTSTNVSHTYDDGSYLVPCVLMAC